MDEFELGRLARSVEDWGAALASALALRDQRIASLEGQLVALRAELAGRSASRATVWAALVAGVAAVVVGVVTAFAKH